MRHSMTAQQHRQVAAPRLETLSVKLVGGRARQIGVTAHQGWKPPLHNDYRGPRWRALRSISMKIARHPSVVVTSRGKAMRAPERRGPSFRLH